MSMIDQVREAISRVPAASGVDDETRLAIASAVLTAMKEPTTHMTVHADDHVWPDTGTRLDWYKAMVEAALLDLSEGGGL